VGVELARQLHLRGGGAAGRLIVLRRASRPVLDRDTRVAVRVEREGGAVLHQPVGDGRISLGDAVGTHVPGVVVPPGLTAGSSGPLAFGFQTIGNFTREFFKPFAVTFDYLEMNLYVTPAVPDH